LWKIILEGTSARSAGGRIERLKALCQGFEDARTQFEVVELSHALDLDQPGRFELLDVVGEGGGRNLQCGLSLRTGQRAVGFGDALEQLKPTRIGQCFQDRRTTDTRQTRCF